MQQNSTKHPRDIGRRRAFTKFSTLCLILIAVFSFKSNASHYRYGNISYTWTSGKTVTFHVSQSYRASYFGGVTVGGTVTDGVVLNFGDGSHQQINLNVTSVNSAEDYFNGEATITHTYANSQNYTAYYNSCCRFGSLVNNSNDSYNNTLTVTLGTPVVAGGTTINSSPVATVAPIVNIAAGQAAATFQIPASDPDGQALTFRTATSAEMGVSATSPQPSGISINSTTGQVTFNTVGKTIGQLYNAAFVITDAQGASTMVDFIIKMVQSSTPPAFDYNVTPANGATYNLQPGQNIAFNVKAQDFDAGDQVAAFNAVGLPSGSSFTPITAAPNNPVQYHFSWTPTSAQLGSRIVSFTAQDNTGNQTATTVTIITSMNPIFDVPPTKALNTFYFVTTGVLHQDTIQAHAPDANVTVQITAATSFSGVTYTTAIPSPSGNTTSTVMSWTPTPAQWGVHTFNFTATDNTSHSTNHTYQLAANTASVITSAIPANTTVPFAQPFIYNVTVTDPDVPYGDEIDYDIPGLPSWLTLTKNSETSATLSGTPGIADTGVYNLQLTVEDSFHHSHAPVQQSFTITVPACTFTEHITVPSIICQGSTATLTADSATSYSWSNGATTKSITVTANNGAVYTVTGVSGACSSTATQTLATSSLPTPVITGSPISAGGICNTYTIFQGYGSQSLTLSAVPSAGLAPYNYTWTPSATVASSHAATTNVSPAATTLYTLAVSDANGCAATATFNVKVINVHCGPTYNGRELNTTVWMCQNNVSSCMSPAAVPAKLQAGACLGACGTALGKSAHSSVVNTKGGITAYPNPAHNSVNVMLGDMGSFWKAYQVVDLTGKVVAMRQLVDGMTQDVLSIDISSLVPGVYLIRVVGNDAVSTSRFTVE